MNNKNALTSAAMLETLWETRNEDIINLITPFVEDCVAQNFSPGDSINIQRVIDEMEKRYGYTDIPDVIVWNVLKREKKFFAREQKNYYLKKALDNVVERLNKRREECERYVEYIGKSLFQYLDSHCLHEKILGEDHALRLLHEFFSYYGLDVGVDRLDIRRISVQNHECFYYIARYITEKQMENGREYNYILALVKGYYLEAALYIQPENGDLKTATYKDVTFYYDTPFLIQLLGYQSEQEEKKAVRLHEMLREQGASFGFFPQVNDEIISILTAYGYSLQERCVSEKTLEGLDRKGYTSTDVRRVREHFQDTLNSKFGIKLVEQPVYATRPDGSVDFDQKFINEEDAKRFILSNVSHYKEDSLTNDVDSAVAIQNLRRGIRTMAIEKCRHLFVTTNFDFVKSFNRYYREHFGSDTFDLTIHSDRLAAITWIKCGKFASTMPELQLLENAYAAQQPPPELMEKIADILKKLESEGVTTYEEAVAIRTDSYTQREFMELYHGAKGNLDEAITDDSVKQICERFREQSTTSVRDETAAHYRAEAEEKRKTLLRQANRKATSEAKTVKNSYISRWNMIVRVISLVVAALAIIGCIISVSWNTNIPGIIVSLLFVLISIVSIYDTISSKQILFSKLIEKRANKKETEEFNKKLNEYMEVIDATESAVGV